MAYQPSSFVPPRGLSNQTTYPSVPYLTAEMYGAKGDGSTDDSAAINAALVAGASVSSPVILLSKIYKCNSQITYDTSKTSLKSEGAQLDFRGIGLNTIAILLTTSQSNSALQVPYNTMHALENLYLQGPGSTGTTVLTPRYAVGFQATTISGFKFICGTKIVGVSASGFDGMFNLSDGTFVNTFVDCSYQNNGPGTGVMFVLTGTSNAGERYNIINASAFNVDGFILDLIGNDNADIYVYSASIDGCNRIASAGTFLSYTPTNARITFFGLHFESQTNQYLAQCGTTGAMIFNSAFFVFQAQINHTLFLSSATGVDGGIILRDCQFADITTLGISGEFICDGTGRFVTFNCFGLSTTAVSMSAVANNQIPLFNLPTSASFTDNWTASGTTAYDGTTAPPNGTGSIKITSTSSSVGFYAPCSAGQIVSVQSWLMSTGITSGSGSFSLQIRYRSSGNDDLATYTNTFTSDIANWSLNRTNVPAAAPPGTVKAFLVISINSGSGAPIVWVGRPVVVCQ